MTIRISSTVKFVALVAFMAGVGTGCVSYKANELSASSTVLRRQGSVQRLYVHASKSREMIMFRNEARTSEDFINNCLERKMKELDIQVLDADDMTDIRKSDDGRNVMSIYNPRRLPAKTLALLGPRDEVLLLSAKMDMNNRALTALNALLFGASLTLIPLYASEPIIVNGVAYNKLGEKTWEGHYAQDVRTIMWFPLFPCALIPRYSSYSEESDPLLYNLVDRAVRECAGGAQSPLVK